MPRPLPVSDSEQAAIVRALLDQIEIVGGDVPPPPAPGEAAKPRIDDRPVVLSRDTPAACRFREDLLPRRDAGCATPPLATSIVSLYRDDGFMPLKLRRELVLANQTPSQNPDPRDPGIVYRREATSGQRKESSLWPLRDYPNAKAWLMVARAVRTADGTGALIYAQIECGLQCSQGQLYQLQRRGDGWIVVATQVLFVS
ncbi:hypothetical protein [Pseudomonas sp. CGJS7]|uniref:hypothetical protein n=1 Tax=Pseudomonas sp. CGJS7 TaxID=3109348 RepID=UPI0030082F0B